MTNPENFDWVTARNSCSMDKAFATLKTRVKDDIEVRNKLLADNLDWEFQMSDNGSSFAVITMTKSGSSGKTVTFQNSKGLLTVNGPDGKMKLKAALTLNSEGECRFCVDGNECDDWYIRKMALEDCKRSVVAVSTLF